MWMRRSELMLKPTGGASIFVRVKVCLLMLLNFLALGWTSFRCFQNNSKLRLSKCINDAIAVPHAEAELAGKSALQLADASVALAYKVILALSLCLRLLFCCAKVIGHY
jgi:hypothetical protein